MPRYNGARIKALPMKKNDNNRNIFSISQLNRQAKQLLESQFPSVWVEGEISNFATPSSGHWYFSLKDNKAQVSCAMFRNSNQRVRFRPEPGQQVLIRAKLSLYEARGDYQLIAEHMEPAGDGALARAFEALKTKLREEGLFDTEHKKALPDLATHLAVITSPTGAAIHDILTVMARRFPSTQVTIIPTAVQGKGAAQEIAKAIKTANKLAKKYGFDVILVGRGGGSLEDLWAFNEELLARAIFLSKLPIVSAVGHEVDFTIADFVADIRAATPSAAAELLTPDGKELNNSFNGYEQLLVKAINNRVNDGNQQLHWLQTRLRHPKHKLLEHSQRLAELELRLINAFQQYRQEQQHRLELASMRLQQLSPSHMIKTLRSQVENLSWHLNQQTQQLIEKKSQQLSTVAQLLNAVSPLSTLDRGYAIVTDDNQRIINDATTIKSGQRLNTRFANGSINSTVD